jgi:hypothetical protein
LFLLLFIGSTLSPWNNRLHRQKQWSALLSAWKASLTGSNSYVVAGALAPDPQADTSKTPVFIAV